MGEIQVDYGFTPLVEDRFFVSNPDKPTIFEKRGNKYEPVCSYLEVVSKTRASDGSAWGRLLRWTTRDGESKEMVVGMREPRG